MAVIKYNYTEHITKVVFGKFICGNKVFHFKIGLTLDKIDQMKAIWHQYYILNRSKRSHDTENHCGYLISWDLAKSPL